VQTPSEKQLASLPAYVQSYIAALERRLESVRRQLAEARGGPENSNVRVRYYSEPDHLLGKDTRVTFDLVDLTRIKNQVITADKPADGPILPRATLEVRHQGIHQVSLLGFPGKLRISPFSSNHILVTVEGL